MGLAFVDERGELVTSYYNRAADPDQPRDPREARAKAIYAEDHAYEVRKSYENPAVARTYAEFLTDGPCGHKSHKLLHTSYTPRGRHIPQE